MATMRAPKRRPELSGGAVCGLALGGLLFFRVRVLLPLPLRLEVGETALSDALSDTFSDTFTDTFEYIFDALGIAGLLEAAW